MQKVHVGNSENGFGIFANKNIKKGETILKFTGKILSYSEATIDKEQEEHLIQVGENQYLEPEKPGFFTNHSCNPNAGLKTETTLVAIKNIKKDEEITFDYSTCMDENDWTMNCNCKKRECRKLIKDFKYLPQKIKQKYIKLEIIPKWLLKRIKQIVSIQIQNCFA